MSFNIYRSEPGAMAPDEVAVDESALRASLADVLGQPSTFDVAPLEGGNANETLAVTWDDRELVVRLPPDDEPAPGVLHDLLREHRVLDALADTWVPVPEVVYACEDTSVIGEPFYVMERLEGDVLASGLPDRFASADHRRQIGAHTVDTLTKIHHVDVDRVGLADFGDPEDYAAKQVERFREQLDWAQERTAASREVPVLREVGDWLAANAPETTHHTLVHGDYKPDNVMFAPGSPPRVAGVLDWEMSRLGDPLADLGWLLSYWTEDRDPSPVTEDLEERFGDHDQFPMLDVYTDEYSTFMRHPDCHTRQALVERYEVQTGYEYRHDRFYRAVAVFKLAALCEGFYRTFLTDSPSAKESYPFMELLVPLLAQQAKAIIDGDTPL